MHSTMIAEELQYVSPIFNMADEEEEEINPDLIDDEDEEDEDEELGDGDPDEDEDDDDEEAADEELGGEE